MATTTDEPLPQKNDHNDAPHLRRVMGPKLLLFFIIGDILGTGIYAVTGTVAGEVGGAIWVSFLVAFLVAMLTATSYAELVGKFPQAAGAALYTNRAFGIPFLTFLVAFAVMSSGITTASAGARAFGGNYLQEFIDLPVFLVAVVFFLVIAAVNFRGVSESVKANVVLTTIELGGLLIVIAIGVLAFSSGDGDASRVVDFSGEGTALSGVVSGAALAFFALVGFEDSVNMAEECQEPQRTFPRALFLGLVITGCVYLLVALTSSLLVDVQTLEDSDAPLLEIVKEGAPWFPLKLFAMIALFALTNTALINMMMASRLIYGMANERIVPSVLGRVHPSRRTPWIAILFTTMLALIVVSNGEVATLGGSTALLLLCVFTMVNIAVLVLRREKVTHKHYQAPVFAPVLGIVCSAYLASPLSGRDTKHYVLAGVLLAVGIVLYFVNRLIVGNVDFDAEKLEKG